MASSELDADARVARLLQRTGFGTAAATDVTAAARAGYAKTLAAALAEGDDPGAGATPAPALGPLPERPKKPGEPEKGSRSEKDPKSEEGSKSQEERGSSEKAGQRDAAGGVRNGVRHDVRNAAARDASRTGADGGGEDGEAADEDARKAYRSALRGQREDAVLWWLDRMVAAERPWREKRTLLWHGHWATSIGKVRSGQAMLAQNETLRRLGGGDFRTLARAMVRDPALLIWLDAPKNTAEAPNENLARELMELFVLGVGNYSEDDVREAAKALTGWTVDRRAEQGPRARFRARRHAGGSRTVLGHSGDLDARALVDLLTEEADCARHLATRWWGWLVSAENAPSRTSLDRLTEAFGARRDITAMLRALFTDPAFTDPDNVLVKQPVEYVVGTLRLLGLRPRRLPEQGGRVLLRSLGGLGQTPFAPPSVGGWPSGPAWLTTAAAQSRLTFAQYVTRAARDTEAMAAIRKETAGERPEALARLLGVREWSKSTRAVLVDASADPARSLAIALTSPEYSVLA
ncbi:DUF1800 domain-containing protein [Streptomyces physcomitrii]|uniref:DUF1800 domain-containing protein n=1 Tax=Streptomyces physcomitrii TaxID=2724184 RepID=A0ABX1HAB4_9ACTN|nr:DUF1800 family protein [Streptomyces physcomitrii]NKI45287.1 DUF1800 domain-containing protein [Streptomyces physcomitrii]